MVTQFAYGVLLARIPLFMFQAVQAALLPRLSRLAAVGELGEFRAGLKRLLMVVLVVGVVGTLGALVLGPFVIEVVYGADLTGRTLAMLALGSACYMVALALAQAVIALKGHALVALGWFIGVVAFLLGTWLSSDDLFRRVEIGLLLSSIAAMAAFALALRYRWPAASSPTPTRCSRRHHRHAAGDVDDRSLRGGGRSIGRQRTVRPALRASVWRSWATIILTRVGKSTSGAQPSLVRALVASPISRSTSAGR